MKEKESTVTLSKEESAPSTATPSPHSEKILTIRISENSHMIPSYPLRPMNGGPLPIARPKRGKWVYEPKINGWRALVHAPTGRMWNRRGQRLTIEQEFTAVLDAIQNATLPPEIEWLDCEALERRHALGKGSLVLLDYLAPDATPYEARQQTLYNALQDTLTAWPVEQVSPPEDRLLHFAYTYQEGGDDDLNPTAAWKRLQALNTHWGAEVFEGFVAKRIDSPYPRQLRSPNQESHHWIKHRWEF